MYRQQEAILAAWEEVTNTSEAMTCFKDCRSFIDNLDNSDIAPNEEGYLGAGQANLLRALNTKMYNETLAKTMHPSHPSMQKKSINEVLAPSHTAATIETIEATNTTNNTESTMNIESMSLSELAELQVKIAARMQELINNQQQPAEVAAEPTPIEEVIEETKQLVERHEVEKKELSTNKNAARLKKSTKKVEEPASNEVVATPTTSAAPTYKEMQKYISSATKSNPAAKAIAQKVAKERGQKSWSTTGSAGYSEIYAQLIKL